MKRTGQKRKAPQHDDDVPIKKARKIEDSIQAMGHYDEDDNLVDSDQDRYNDNGDGDDSMDSNDGFEYLEEDEGAQYDDDDDMPELADISNDDSANVGKNKNRKKKKDPLTKLPSSDEIRLLKETESMFKSNLFRMEMEELLNVCRPSDSEALKQAVKNLKHVLDKLPDKNIKVANYKKKFPGLPVKNNDVAFTFRAPTKVAVVGSYLTQTMSKPELNVDITVEIPSPCLKQTDVKDYRYYDIRALYLAVIAEELTLHSEFSETQWQLWYEDPLKPILVVRPQFNNQKVSKTVVKIIPCIKNGEFKLNKLLPNKGNLTNDKESAEEASNGVVEGGNDETSSPSPRYNNGVMEDMHYSTHLELIHNTVGSSVSIIDAVVLLKTWLRKRQNYKHDGEALNGFVLTMIVVHLMNIKRVNTSMSSYQIIKVVLQFLSTSDILTNGLFMNTSLHGDAKEVPSDVASVKQQFLSSFDVVFLDPSSRLNLTARVSKYAMLEIIEEARHSLAILDDPRHERDSFEALWSPAGPWPLHWDRHVRLPAMSPRELRRVISILGQAWGERVKFIRVLNVNGPTTWDVTGVKPQPTPIVLGLTVEPTKATKMVEIGPAADDLAQAEKFREFWGDKAEIRRFKDGTIALCTVWECPLEDRHTILERMAMHVLARHLTLTSQYVHFTYDQLDFALGHHLSCVSKLGLEPMEAWTALSKHLRGLSGQLPLAIKDLLLVDTVFRFTEPVPMKPYPFTDKAGKKSEHPSYIRPFQALVQFEASGSWPDDLIAIQKIKTAFYLKISEVLRKQGDVMSSVTEEHIDIYYQGYIFRFEIFYPREVLLLDKLIVDRNSTDAVNEKRIHMIDRPSLAGLMHSLHLKHSSFGLATRIAKRWLTAHELSAGHYFTEELIELLMAYIYTDVTAYRTPASHFTAFFRFLHLLASFDWSNSPLIINFENDLTKSDLDEIYTHYEKVAVKPVLFVAYSHCKIDNIWVSKNRPSHLIWKRIVALARHTLDLAVHTQFDFSAGIAKNWRVLFTPSTRDFDVAVTLKSDVLPRQYQQLASDAHTNKTKVKQLSNKVQVTAYKNLYNRNVSSNLLVDFDPVQCYLRELRERFSSLALFFHDTWGGDVIHVVWIPTSFMPHKKFKLDQNLCCKTTHDEHGKVVFVPNKDELLHDMRAMGEGLVADIVSLKKK